MVIAIVSNLIMSSVGARTSLVADVEKVRCGHALGDCWHLLVAEDSMMTNSDFCT